MTYITTAAALADLVAAVRREPRVAVDTEAASFHRYRDRIYLIQLSSARQTALIDPLALTDLTPIGAVLADPAIEKVLHDADYDLRVLDRDYGFRAARLFDTRIAAQLLGEPAIGLAALLEKYLGVKLAKEHQKADWSQRPLPPAMLDYAAADTQHLLTLRDLLDQRLAAAGRRSWAAEEFAQLESLRWTGVAEGETDPHLRVKGARGLHPRSLAAFRELHRWREGLAERDDRAAFRVIGNDALLAVSRALPKGAPDLAEIRELPPSLARRHGTALLDAVARARAIPESELPRLPRTPRVARDPGWDARVERLKAARNTVAAALGLDPGVLCGRPLLEEVARTQRLDVLRQWQREVLGDALRAALRPTDPA